MSETWVYLSDIAENAIVRYCGIFLLALIIGYVLSRMARKLLHSVVVRKRIPAHITGIAENILSVAIWLIVILQAFHASGINIVGLLGAAGVAGVAIGFASQTALSNLISGIFIVSERSIKIGNYIRVASQEGTVQAINLFSITLRQVDNSLVRIPCETLIKTPIINVTVNARRRIDLDLGVDYASDLQTVRSVIQDVILKQKLLANDPAPVVQFLNFGDSSVNLHIGAWCATPDYHEARFLLAQDLLVAFRQHDINIPFPTRSLLMAEKQNTAS